MFINFYQLTDALDSLNLPVEIVSMIWLYTVGDWLKDCPKGLLKDVIENRRDLFAVQYPISGSSTNIKQCLSNKKQKMDES